MAVIAARSSPGGSRPSEDHARCVDTSERGWWHARLYTLDCLFPAMHKKSLCHTHTHVVDVPKCPHRRLINSPAASVGITRMLIPLTGERPGIHIHTHTHTHTHWNTQSVMERRAFYFAHLASSLGRWFETITLHSVKRSPGIHTHSVATDGGSLSTSHDKPDEMESNGGNSETWQRFTWSGQSASCFLSASGQVISLSLGDTGNSFTSPPLRSSILTAAVVLPMTSALLAEHPSRRALANIFISYLLRRYGVVLSTVNTNIHRPRRFFSVSAFNTRDVDRQVNACGKMNIILGDCRENII